MKKIQIPFPIYEGLEVKTATVDLDKGVSVIEYGEKENIQKEILVPDNIKIYQCFNHLHFGDQLFISFNDNKQCLGWTDLDHGLYLVDRTKYYEEIPCKLTPCKREDLKAGDTGFCCGTNKDFCDIMNYMKVLDDGANDFVWIEEGTNICLCTEFDDPDYVFFKVEPIN